LSSLITDVAGNELSNASNAVPGRIVTRLIPDNQPAIFEEFTFNMNESIPILTFNEPVRAIFL